MPQPNTRHDGGPDAVMHIARDHFKMPSCQAKANACASGWRMRGRRACVLCLQRLFLCSSEEIIKRQFSLNCGEIHLHKLIGKYCSTNGS